MLNSTPGSPRPNVAREGLNHYIEELSREWDLNIAPHREGDSPRKRKDRAIATDEEDAERCISKISHLWYKDRSRLARARSEFEREAVEMQTGWMHKSRVDHDLLPNSSSPATSLSLSRRLELLRCLHRHVLHNSKEVSQESMAQRSFSSSMSLGDADTMPGPDQPIIGLDDVPGNSRGAELQVTDFRGLGHSKRRSNGGNIFDGAFKKPRLPSSDNYSTHEAVNAADHVPTRTHELPRSRHDARQSSPSPFRVAPVASSSNLVRALSDQEELSVQSIDTPNVSFTSHTSSVFSRRSNDDSTASIYSIQTTALDNSFDDSKTGEHHPSSHTHYGSDMSDEDYFDAVLTQPLSQCDIEEQDESSEESPISDPDGARGKLIALRLEDTFPELPASLIRLSLPVRYEITRVFLHAGVSLHDLKIPVGLDLHDYSALWTFLKQHPSLLNKNFPEKSSRDAWDASMNRFTCGSRGVVMSGNLHFRKASEGPVFHFQLQPLKTDITHRLSRRFGNDRFFEITIPGLSPRNLSAAGSLGREAVVKWIVHRVHKILSLEWKTFYVKPDKVRKAGKDYLSKESLDSTASHRLYLFAIDGVGFQATETIPRKDENPRAHTAMPVKAMLNWLIPLQRNQEQPFLKLFSRVRLGLSKTYATVVLSPSEIVYRPQDLKSRDGETMNDGCGEISLRTALKIVDILGLSHVPSGFQARIGGAKGFWVVNYDRKTDTDWIDIYPSQTKWVAHPFVYSDEDTDHRTFEVVQWASPLRSANLNLQFLPLIEDRGESQGNMRNNIAHLLKSRLTHEISKQRSAMDSPYLFRVWARDNNTGIQDRIKYGHVPFEAGLPVSREERLGMLSDAGFDPKKLQYLRDQARQAYSSKCQALKEKLNITIGRSTYAYMVVDFRGILEPDEVHLGFSSRFTDEVSGFNETFLHDMKVLVARSPAHYTSDIQKVKAVFKLELRSLKDVIVFSSKGDFPLAKKLSGGDYDGDIAWICWEPSLVDNFQNDDIPVCPDLVKLGHLEKDCTTYEDLVVESADPTALLLERSLDFNLQEAFLGICTGYKERVCYARNNVRNDDAVFLSTLLSLLVDQAKQGYTFTKASWDTIKKEVIKFEGPQPAYKGNTFHGRPYHIIDYLKFVVAHDTVEKTLTEFHQSLPDADTWDEDVVKLSQRAKEQAKKNSEWAHIMTRLQADIEDVRRTWNVKLRGRDLEGDERKGRMSMALNIVYSQWISIMPSEDTLVTRSLLLPFASDSELSPWALLKASVCFHDYHASQFVWRMAGKQLCHLKAMACGKSGTRTITEEMYAMLRPDATFVKLILSEEHEPQFHEARAESELRSDQWEADASRDD
ncbi:MAG: hypothetical protein M1818_007176 [Claussenomyces sp. TS43310]|nr:MAG: hypothetical protein M1818_007176 [Claussenomyces sp. TS43310]